MKKVLTVLVAAALSGVAVVGTSSSADARWGWGYGGWGYGGSWGYRGVGCCGGGWGYRGLGWGPGGFAAGAAIGAALATPTTTTIRSRLIRPITITPIRPPLIITMAWVPAAAATEPDSHPLGSRA